jgi:hypothetical protein
MNNKVFKYNCEKCDYHNNNLSNFKKHLSTAKHRSEKLSNKKVNKSGEKVYCCENCGKQYKVRNSLWYHKKKCKISFVSSENHFEKENAELKQMIFEVMDKMSQQNKVIQELAPKVGNNNNNQFNINVFLNETCKDAINISDFVKSIEVGMKELEFTKSNGIVKGVSTILTKNLNKLEIEKRPIHCTDVKRNTLYIKNKDEWNKNNEEIVENTIENVKNKHIKALKEWEQKNPDWAENPEKSAEYLRLMKESTTNLVEKDQKSIISDVSKITKVE